MPNVKRIALPALTLRVGFAGGVPTALTPGKREE